MNSEGWMANGEARLKVKSDGQRAKAKGQMLKGRVKSTKEKGFDGGRMSKHKTYPFQELCFVLMSYFY